MLSGARLRAAGAIPLSVLLWPTSTRAQSADAIFGTWSARPLEVGARPSGLGGAFTAVADDSRSAVLNPAGIALVPHTELAAATSDLWVVGAFALRPRPPVAVPPRPGGGAVILPCPERRVARPWAVAAFAERTRNETARLEVVDGPRRLEEGTLTRSGERIGASLARGLTSWLDLGATVSWSHLDLLARSTLRTAEGAELRRTIVEGAPNKLRLAVGALAVFGPPGAHTAPRLGVSYHRDLSRWSAERRTLDVENGTAEPPQRVTIEEPTVLSTGLALRFADNWLLSGQVDYVWYEQVLEALRREGIGPFRLRNGLEPRLGLEYTINAPIGGYLKLRGGLRRESSGQALYEGQDLALRQAFRGAGNALRGSAGASLFAEFYDRAARLDLDISRVVVGTRSSPTTAPRRFSFGLTFRL